VLEMRCCSRLPHRIFDERPNSSAAPHPWSRLASRRLRQNSVSRRQRPHPSAGGGKPMTKNPVHDHASKNAEFCNTFLLIAARTRTSLEVRVVPIGDIATGSSAPRASPSASQSSWSRVQAARAAHDLIPQVRSRDSRCASSLASSLKPSRRVHSLALPPSHQGRTRMIGFPLRSLGRV
jgi:hypothetical protein